jgi:modulator of FtsH protease HflC
MKRYLYITAALAAIVVICFLASCFITADEANYIVVTQFGKPVKTISESGLHFKYPWPAQISNRIDKRKQLYETPLIEFYTGDQKNIVVQSFVCWQISEPLEYFKSVRTGQMAEQILDDTLVAVIGASLGRLKMSNLISVEPGDVKVTELENNVTTEMNETVRSYGIEICRIGLSRLALPEDNVRAVYQRMIADRTAIANEYRALGQEKADKIRSEADKERNLIIAEANKKAEIIKGEGDAESARIYADAYSQAPELFRLLQTLETYKKILKERTTIIMSSESELLKYLDGSSYLSENDEINKGK